MSEAYREPVAQLLSLGAPEQETFATSEWRDYLALGLTAEDVPELARMALDEELNWGDPESGEVWASLHAWRTLAQLRAESAIQPLIQLLLRVDDYDDDWMMEDLPRVFGMIGPATIPGLRDVVADSDHDELARLMAIEGLVEVVEHFPETREQIVHLITDQLRRFADQGRAVNAFLVLALCDLHAVESADVIEQAYAADRVDLLILGDWEEAQILLGLLEERVTPAPNFLAMELGLSFTSDVSDRPHVEQPRPRRAKRRKKARRKQAKASRKRNRRR